MGPSYEHIRQLYIEKLSGVISEPDDARLAQWLATNEEVQRIWRSLEKDAEGLGVDGFRQELDVATELGRVKQRFSTTPVRRMRPYGRYAAIALLLTVSGAAYWMMREGEPFVTSVSKTPVSFPLPPSEGTHVRLITSDGQSVNLGEQTVANTITLDGLEIRAAAGELQAINAEEAVMSRLIVPPKTSYKITLPDGSTVHLNALSTLRFPTRFADSIREVSLEGEGYFEITHDSRRPFIVHLENTQVEVLGTRFNLNTYTPKKMETALVEGSVRVHAANGQTMRLQPGYAATYNGADFQRSAFDSTVVLSWMEGVYYFRHASLDELAPVINRWYGLSVTVEDAALIRHRITGLMEREDIAYFLADLKASTGVAHRIEGDTLYLY